MGVMGEFVTVWIFLLAQLMPLTEILKLKCLQLPAPLDLVHTQVQELFVLQFSVDTELTLFWLFVLLKDWQIVEFEKVRGSSSSM